MNHRPAQRRGTSAASPARLEPLEPRRLLAAVIEPPLQFLGDVGTGYHQQIVRNVPARRTDSWGFNITKPVALTLLADRLKHDGDLILQRVHSRGQTRTLAKSSNPGRASERIELTLEPGRYNVILANQASKTNSYRLPTRTAEVAAPSRVEATVWSGTSAHVRWLDNSHNETGFRVQQWIRGRWKNVAEAGRNATAAVVSGHLQPGHEPVFRVVARRGEAAIASTNTMSLTMNGSDESGWYRVTGLTYKGKGEAGWDDQGSTLKIRNEFTDSSDSSKSIWVQAANWKQAVWTVIQGQFHVQATFDAGWIKKGDTVTHNFPSGGDFVVGTEAEIRQIGLGSNRKASYFKDNPASKVIAVEDAYWELDRDYDDWWWEVTTEFVRLESLTVSGTHEGTAKSVTASEGTTGSLSVTANEQGQADISLDGMLVVQPPGTDVVRWQVTTDRGDLVDSGGFDADGKGGTVTLDIATKQLHYTLSGGVDANADGQLSGEEIDCSIHIDVVSTWEVAYPEVFEKLTRILDLQGALGAKLTTAKGDLNMILGGTILAERAYAAANAANANKSLWGLIWDTSADVPAITAATVGMALQVPALTNLYQNSVIIQKGVKGMRGLSAGTKTLIRLCLKTLCFADNAP